MVKICWLTNQACCQLPNPGVSCPSDKLAEGPAPEPGVISSFLSGFCELRLSLLWGVQCSDSIVAFSEKARPEGKANVTVPELSLTTKHACFLHSIHPDRPHPSCPLSQAPLCRLSAFSPPVWSPVLLRPPAKPWKTCAQQHSCFCLRVPGHLERTEPWAVVSISVHWGTRKQLLSQPQF